MKYINAEKFYYKRGYEDRDKEIIRCKDCMYFHNGWCMNEDVRYGYVNGDDATTFEPDEDFWCKYGERKDEVTK